MPLPTFPPPPRIARILAGMDDEVFDPDNSASAWGISVLAANANLAKARGGLMQRWLGNAGTLDPDAPNAGAGLSYAWPFWNLGIPMLGLPTPKKPGLTRMRVAVRGVITDEKIVEFQFASLGNGHGGELVETPPEDQILVCEGTGAEERYTKDDIVVHSDAGEVITCWARGKLDRDNDALLNTGTFGGKNTGTAGNIRWAAGEMNDSTVPTPWADVAEGGHYILFIAPADDRIVHVAVVLGQDIDNGETLYFWPPGDPTTMPAFGLTYELRKMIDLRLFSVVGYSVDAVPEE